jgi:hypothetical protein
MVERHALRFAIAAMLLLAGMPFPGLVRGLYAHLAAGHPLAHVPAKLLGVTLTGTLILLAGIILTRALRTIGIERRGIAAAAAITDTARQNDGTWIVSYAYRDRGGESRTGFFRTDPDLWREADKGEVRFDSENPGRSVWMTEIAPAREPRPVPPVSPRKSLMQYAGIIAASSLVLAGCATGYFWVAIWQKGGAATASDLETLGVLAVVFGMALPFAALTAGMVITFGGGLVLGCFLVVRRALRG